MKALNRAFPRLSACVLTALLTLSLASHGLAAPPVDKLIDSFETLSWHVSADNTAGGMVKLSADASNVNPGPKSSLNSDKRLHTVELQADFSGKGFEVFAAVPPKPIVIPGVTQRLTLSVHGQGKYGWVVQYKDGWGRSEVNGRRLEWPISPIKEPNDTSIRKLTLDIPADFVQPVTIVGLMTHNWESQSVKGSATLALDSLSVVTDLSDVDAKSGVLKTWNPPTAAENAAAGGKLLPQCPAAPLLSDTITATQPDNVFSGAEPGFTIDARNWRAEAAVGSLHWSVTDAVGVSLESGDKELKIADATSFALPLHESKFGLYYFDAKIAWADGTRSSSKQSFAVIPVARTLSEADKDASPYGLNVLSARQPMVATFRKAGIVWFRDYGFRYDWMLRAKGTDGRYAGWPYYPRIVNDYDSNGARLVANIQTSIQPPRQGSALGPDRTWTREMVGILTAFPSIRAFELDNEYDLGAEHARAEEPIDWKNYGLFHKKFGDLAKLLGDGQIIAVENGRAGIWPERLTRMVQTGDFANIDVVNSHHYTGTDAPEINVGNFNMGFSGDETVMSFYDQLRAAKRAGSIDGKARQHWLTEFGWDTLAGPVVTPVQQSAYLARAYMLLAAAGTSKGFWFWDLDSEVAKQFFDGCGLFTFDQQPKRSYVEYAGLTQILPKAEYLGRIYAGDNTWGYLFRNGVYSGDPTETKSQGSLVASLWTLDGKPGPKIDFASAVPGGVKVYDCFANKLDSTVVQLGIDPVYAVGVGEDSRWFKQACYDLESPNLASATAGDTITATISVTDRRKDAIYGTAHLELPKGWTDLSGKSETEISVPAGKTAEVSLSFKVSADETIGEKPVRVVISEGEPVGKPIDVLPIRVQVQRPIVMTVRGLTGNPGESIVNVRLTNRSARPLDGALHFRLPSSWSTATPEVVVSALKPMEVRDVRVPVRWSADWKQTESATVEYRSVDGRSVQQPVIPPQLTIHRIADAPMNGDISKWPASCKLPDWVLGTSIGESKSSVYMGWSSKGLYVAVDVKQSKATVPDPRTFWDGDVLELFLDTGDNKSPRQYSQGDHQFWLAPLVENHRAYVGQWKRGTELSETAYDLQGMQSFAARQGDGYVMECLIPASDINGFRPVAGTRMGLNVNLTIKSLQQDREVFWPLPKSASVEQPASWGDVIFAE